MSPRQSALTHFKKADPRLYAATLPHHPSLPLTLPTKRTRAQLFSSLVSIVVSQQLGTAAADTIFRRLNVACGGSITPQKILALSPATLRTAGLSGSKIKTLKTLAKEVESGRLDLTALKRMSADAAAERLTQIWGLGPWSVEMFMMFCSGHPDMFSAGDLGLARSIEAIYGLPKGTTKEKLQEISLRWSPYRTYASLLLWKTRDVVPQTISNGRHRSSSSVKRSYNVPRPTITAPDKTKTA